MEIYVVQPGDTLASIAREFGVSLSSLILFNELPDDENITVGQTIVILFPNTIYTVQEGDTLESIAVTYGVSVNELLRNNPQLKGMYEIFPGQTIYISFNYQRRGELGVNGYIYPFVERETLIRTLPFLTYITLFTYGFTEEGMLVETGITDFGLDEDEIISLSREYGVAPLMHLSTLMDDGMFSSQLGDAILNNPEARAVLIENLISRMKEKGYYGLDVDFEYLDTRNRDSYTGFIAELKEALSAEGLVLFTARAPKSSGDQPGAFYESHDYGGIGSVSDYVLLMTYEWGYAFGPPMAVAPLDQVENVLGYAVSVINTDKIYLGIPNYAYDWPLPYVRGTTKAEKISNVTAVSRAINNNVPIMFNEVAQSPFYNYFSGETEHVVWFEDARSIESKLELAEEYGVAGVGYWNLMQWFPQNWLVLNSLYNIEKVL